MAAVVAIENERKGGRGREGGRERCLPVQRHVEVWQRTLHTGADRSVHQGSVWKHPLLLIGSMTQTLQEADNGQETKAEGGGGRDELHGWREASPWYLSCGEEKVNVLLADTITHCRVEILADQLKDIQKTLLCLIELLQYT